MDMFLHQISPPFFWRTIHIYSPAKQKQKTLILYTHHVFSSTSPVPAKIQEIFMLTDQLRNIVVACIVLWCRNNYGRHKVSPSLSAFGTSTAPLLLPTKLSCSFISRLQSKLRASLNLQDSKNAEIGKDIEIAYLKLSIA